MIIFGTIINVIAIASGNLLIRFLLEMKPSYPTYIDVNGMSVLVFIIAEGGLIYQCLKEPIINSSKKG